MEDRDIIKALECRVKDKCPECPYFHSYPCDKCRNMQTDALDLINRLQEKTVAEQNYADCLNTEIDKLKQNLKEAHIDIREHMAEIEKKDNKLQEVKTMIENVITQNKKNTQKMIQTVEKECKKLKAEAYKECIEKVKATSNKMELVCSGALVQTDYIITENTLDNLLKELVGDTDES